MDKANKTMAKVTKTGAVQLAVGHNLSLDSFALIADRLMPGLARGFS
jgi:hypothetical protein